MQHFYQNYTHHGFSVHFNHHFLRSSLSGEHTGLAEYLKMCWLITHKLSIRPVLRGKPNPLGVWGTTLQKIIQYLLLFL